MSNYLLGVGTWHIRLGGIFQQILSWATFRQDLRGTDILQSQCFPRYCSKEVQRDCVTCKAPLDIYIEVHAVCARRQEYLNLCFPRCNGDMGHQGAGRASDKVDRFY